MGATNLLNFLSYKQAGRKGYMKLIGIPKNIRFGQNGLKAFDSEKNFQSGSNKLGSCLKVFSLENKGEERVIWMGLQK